jgi:hypothetical protein
MTDRVSSLLSLVPGAEFVINGTEETWINPTSCPVTEEQIQAEITRLEADYAAKQYQRDRAAAYPSFADQFDLLYHGGFDAWKAAIDAIKQTYPKPEGQ